MSARTERPLPTVVCVCLLFALLLEIPERALTCLGNCIISLIRAVFITPPFSISMFELFFWDAKPPEALLLSLSLVGERRELNFQFWD